MKYKTLTKEQILISLDRLTRFKTPKEKYLRVFFDIILSCLIEPKYKRSELEKLDEEILVNIVETIFNKSVYKILSLPEDMSVDLKINKRLKDYEISIYNIDPDYIKLLDNKIDYANAIKIIKEDAVINLKWLKQLNSSDSMFESRSKLKLKFPIEKVLLVEGITEEILLPAFGRTLNYDFYQHGIQIIPAGGKNQVVKMYYKLAQELKIPIFVLLDKDAEENINQIKPKLRTIDKIHLVSCGEFEDLLPKSLIINTVNSHFKNFLAITKEDLNTTLPMAKCLEEIFKTKGLHEFKKAEFAKLVRCNISPNAEITTEITEIIKEISNMK